MTKTNLHKLKAGTSNFNPGNERVIHIQSLYGMCITLSVPRLQVTSFQRMQVFQFWFSVFARRSTEAYIIKRFKIDFFYTVYTWNMSSKIQT